MSRHLKLIAAVAVVLVAISGFSPAKSGGKGGSRSSSKGGGGCSSSSSSSHNSSSSSYDGKDSYDSDYGDGYKSDSRRYNNTTGSSGSRNSSSSSDSSPTGTVTQCAADSGTDAKAVVSVNNPNGSRRTYSVKVEFSDTAGTFVDYGTARVNVGANERKPVDVRMDNPARIDEVSDCEVVSVS